MIERVEFAHYKKIGEKPILLDDLAGVNYFVGENSSGKTSLLRYIFEMNRPTSMWITDSFSELDHLQEFDFKKNFAKQKRNVVRELFTDSILEYHFLSLDLLAYSILKAKQGLKWRVLDEELYREAISLAQEINVASSDLIISDNGVALELDGEELNSGAHKLINIIYGVLWSYKNQGTRFFMFDNPGDNLHPSWQKKLPIVFQYLSIQLDVQIFVATHSPFVITAAGVLGEIPEIPLQKVYFLTKGQVANKHGLPSHKGSRGYWGTRVAEISTRMLGVGLMDLVARQTPAKDSASPVLVLCEGEGLNADARIYNIIFRSRIPEVLFVSSRGSSQLYKSFSILSQIKPSLSADFEVRMLRDRDHEYPTEQAIYDYEKDNSNSRILRKRAIECYIFNPDTARLVLNLFNKKLMKKDLESFRVLDQKIYRTIVEAVQGDDYKEELLQWFQIATRGFLRELMHNSPNTLMEKIAYLVYPGHPVYEALEGIIFN